MTDLSSNILTTKFKMQFLRLLLLFILPVTKLKGNLYWNYLVSVISFVSLKKNYNVFPTRFSGTFVAFAPKLGIMVKPYEPECCANVRSAVFKVIGFESAENVCAPYMFWTAEQSAADPGMLARHHKLRVLTMALLELGVSCLQDYRPRLICFSCAWLVGLSVCLLFVVCITAEK